MSHATISQGPDELYRWYYYTLCLQSMFAMSLPLLRESKYNVCWKFSGALMWTTACIFGSYSDAGMCCSTGVKKQLGEIKVKWVTDLG